jgi:hypothetical protein
LSALHRKFPKILNRPYWKLSEQTLTCWHLNNNCRTLPSLATELCNCCFLL